MKASLIPTVFVLRIHPGQDGPPAPYVGSATVVVRDDEAEILGLSLAVPWTAGMRVAVFDALRSVGIRWAIWERRSEGGVRAVRRAV